MRGEIQSKFVQILCSSEANLEIFFNPVKERVLNEIILEDTKKGYNYVRSEITWFAEKIKSQYKIIYNMIYQAVNEILEGLPDVDISNKEEFVK